MTCACGHELDEHDSGGMDGTECCVEECDCIYFESDDDNGCWGR